MTKVHKKVLEKVESLHRGKPHSLANAEQPENRTRQNMAQTMYQAWKLFGDPDAVLLFLNEPELFPICHFEQMQFIHFEVEKIAKKRGEALNVVQMTLKECTER